MLLCLSRGQLGLGSVDDAVTPVPVPVLEGLRCVDVAAGGWHSAAVSGAVSACGTVCPHCAVVEG